MTCPSWWPYAAEFPGWEVWRGVDRLYYAGLAGTDPYVLVRGEDPVDLRDQIRSVLLRPRRLAPRPGRSQAAAAWMSRW